MSTGEFQLLVVLLSVMSVIIIPLFILMIRGIIKWTRVEDKLDQLVSDMRNIVIDKEKTHEAMLRQMGEDRMATDRRLRWLEENVWNRAHNKPDV